MEYVTLFKIPAVVKIHGFGGKKVVKIVDGKGTVLEIVADNDKATVAVCVRKDYYDVLKK